MIALLYLSRTFQGPTIPPLQSLVHGHVNIRSPLELYLFPVNHPDKLIHAEWGNAIFLILRFSLSTIPLQRKPYRGKKR